MERSICGPRPTVLSANLYQSYPLTVLFLAPKTPDKVSPKKSPRKVSTKCSPSMSKFLLSSSFPSSYQLLKSHLSTLPSIFLFINSSNLFSQLFKVLYKFVQVIQLSQVLNQLFSNFFLAISNLPNCLYQSFEVVSQVF